MHEGHRYRLVSKVKDDGIVYEHELMEILLFNACPRKDVNATAHALVNRFDGIEGVFKADCAELVKVNGVGANMAEYIAVLGRALRSVKNIDGFALLPNVSGFRNYILSRPAPKTDCLELYCLDKDGRVRRICRFEAKRGFRAAPSGKELLRLLSAHRPYGLFAANRRAGGCYPERLDDTLCERIDEIARLCGSQLYDYALVDGDGGFYSFKMADRAVFVTNAAGDDYGE